MSGMDNAIAFGNHQKKRTMYARLVGACLGVGTRAHKLDSDPTKFEYAAATVVDKTKAADEAIANCTTEREMLMVVKPYVMELAELMRMTEPAEGEDQK